MKPKLLFLFADGWDDSAIAPVPAIGRDHDIVREGFDVFRFPENANLLWFDARKFVARLAQRYRNRGAREEKWMGSYRYAIVNLGATSREDLEYRFADVCRHVSFEREAASRGQAALTASSFRP